MHTTLKVFCIGFLFALAVPVLADGDQRTPDKSTPAATCEHGVKKTLCTRCNPKLAAVFKAKGDWCVEHERPESQCAICHPHLKKQGIKP